MNPLALIPTAWLWPAIGAVGLAMSCAIGVQTWRVQSLQTDLAQQIAQGEARMATYAIAAASAASAALAETDRRLKAQEGVVHAAEIQTAQARADAVAADRARGSLQQRFAAVAARCGAARADPGAAQPSPAASSPGAMLADVLSRLDAAAGELAAYADASRAAGLACERSYDALIR